MGKSPIVSQKSITLLFGIWPLSFQDWFPSISMNACSKIFAGKEKYIFKRIMSAIYLAMSPVIIHEMTTFILKTFFLF